MWPEDDSGRSWEVEAETAHEAIMHSVPRLTRHAVTVYDVASCTVSIASADYSATVRASAA